MKVQAWKVYSRSCKTSMREFFVRIVNGWKTLTVFTKSSILDISERSEYASGHNQNSSFRRFLLVTTWSEVFYFLYCFLVNPPDFLRMWCTSVKNNLCNSKKIAPFLSINIQITLYLSLNANFQIYLDKFNISLTRQTKLLT